MRLGAIEAGGTKFVCAVSDENLTFIERIAIPTTTPKETMKAVYTFFDKYQVEAIGIGSFGPIDVNPLSETYGNITSTPKPGWQNFPFLTEMKKRYAIPFAWTTDVNAAAYGELKNGAARQKRSCMYLTVGTGIGAGIVVNEKIIQGFSHPEAGHVLIRRHSKDDYEGNCPFHKDCLEGMASGPAIEKRFKKPSKELSKGHPAWSLEAYYLAQALVGYTLTLSPEIIILGGGVMKQTQLFSMIQEEFKKLLNHYVETPPVEDYIVPCELGDNAGIVGCLLLAKDKLNS